MSRLKPELFLKLYDELDCAVQAWPMLQRYWPVPLLLVLSVGSLITLLLL